MHPFENDEDLFEALCEQLFEKRLSLIRALDAIKVRKKNFYKQIGKDAGFAAVINAIRESQAEMLADELLDIADNPELNHKQRSCMVDTRKWYLSKIVPRFRDKQEIEHKGLPDALTDDERATRVATLLDAARARRDRLAAGEPE